MAGLFVFGYVNVLDLNPSFFLPNVFVSFKKNHKSCCTPNLFINIIFLPLPYLVQSILDTVDGYSPPIAVEPCAKLCTVIETLPPPDVVVYGTNPVKAITPVILLG